MRLPVIGGKGGLVCFEVLGGGRRGGCEGRGGEGSRVRGWRTVRRPRLMEPTNLQIAIVERDMVWVCFDDFADDCGEGRRGGC